MPTEPNEYLRKYYEAKDRAAFQLPERSEPQPEGRDFGQQEPSDGCPTYGRSLMVDP